MTSFNFRRKLLIVLLSLAIVLVAAKILLKDKISFSDHETLLNEAEIRDKFNNILDDFGIDQKLIKEKRIKDNSSGTEISSYKVQVPVDLSIPEILAEVFQTFKKDSLKIISAEKIKGGKTFVSFKNGDDVFLNCEFDYSKTYHRNKGYVSFVIRDVHPDNPSALRLLESTEKINFLLLPGSSNLKQQEIIQKYGQQFSVLVDDNISEQKYKLDPGYSEVRIVTVIKTLVTDYQQAVCFIVDDNSAFYKSKNFEIFERELSKRKIKLFTTSDFVKLDNDENLRNDFINQIGMIDPGGSKIFLMNEETFFSIEAEIKKFKKLGYRFIASSLILQN